MNDLPDDDLLLTTADKRSVADRDVIFHDVIAAHKAEQYYNKERSRAGWWTGCIGAAIGLAGVLSAAVVAIAHKPVVRYTEINTDTGVIRESIGAADAPDHFNERVVRHYLGEYVAAQEEYVWQLDPTIDHRVKLMSTPQEQARYAERRIKDNLGSKYGMIGYSRVVRWGDFNLHAKGADKTLEYDVQFIKGEVLANTTIPKETRMTARIVFQFHPELSMNSQDRIDNEAGLMVIHYSSSAD